VDDEKHTTPGALNRRGFIAGAAGVAVGAAGLPQLTANAVADDGARGGRGTAPRIDVHAHYLPPDYREALIAHGQANPDGFPVLPTWSAEAHLAMMGTLNIQTAMLSVSSPGVGFGGDAVEWARRVNEAGAQTVRDHPGRFGLFASLPLPDVQNSLAELRHALDTLRADGVVLLTNFGGTYLGDPSLEEVFAELNRRRAVAFLHPTSPACWEATSLGYPRPILEFLLDTTRAVANMVLNGTLTKYPDIRLIVPHAGGALPVLVDRIAGFAGLFPLGGQAPGSVDVVGTLQRLYYEVGAGFPFPRHVAALLNLVEAGQLLYGTDFPFGGLAGIQANAENLDNTDLLNHRELHKVLRGNALNLFPRLRS
jgi:predicted TIM-barrel fold metal-dependent hydrolase